MTRTSANEIRQQFIDYFVQKHGHTFVPSSPCVPTDDPTLMFTNAGMNQFKDVFLATGTRPYVRAANSQKCIRAGGKHNDLDDVGHDTYHHTFFEMLGNWSFGDYFKAEAIEWAWDLLTNVWGLEKDRLYATYFEGDAAEGLEPDTEARDLWLKILPPQRVCPGNKKDNFWEMGDTGPCGPCSEIHIDLTPDKTGGPLVNAGDPQVMEIWNLVFIQFNRGADGALSPLPAKHVDTGMGFERITAIIQGMSQGRLAGGEHRRPVRPISNYDTDIFTTIFTEISKVTGAPPYTGLLEGPTDPNRARQKAVDARTEETPDKTDHAAIMRDVAYRVVADHLRCLVFAITDGAVPDNEGRGYVLRRILRRAVRYGRQYLGTSGPFLHKLVPVLADTMGGAYPELTGAHDGRNVAHVQSIILDEEESFGKTLDRGIVLFNRSAMAAAFRALRPDAFIAGPLPSSGGLGARSRVESETVFTGDPSQRFDLRFNGKHLFFDIDSLASAQIQAAFSHQPIISGEDAFKLYDTDGFPIDITVQMAEEHGLTVDIHEYERLMEAARAQARAAVTKFADFLNGFDFNNRLRRTEDSYKYSQVELSANLTLIRSVTRNVPEELRGQQKYVDLPEAAAVLDKTCFYAEQGGQVADTGTIETETGTLKVERVVRKGESILHVGSETQGKIKDGQSCHLRIDVHKRSRITKNHTSTHLLNWALREVLGDHVQQKGSLVDPEKTRFDLSHRAQITEAELERIELLVNEKINADLPVYAEEVSQAEALKIYGLRAVFGEKYPDIVRVVSIGVPVTAAGAEKAGRADWLLKTPDSPEWRQYSVEFCGGTHLNRTAEAGRFRLIEESAVAKGIRRVVGVTGERAQEVERAAAQLARELDEASEHLQQPLSDGRGSDQDVSALNTKLNTTELPLLEKNRLRARLSELQEHVKTLKKQAAKSGTADILDRTDDLLAGAEKHGDHALIAANMGEATIDQLRTAADALRSRAGSAAVFLAGQSEGKAVLLAAMTKDIAARGIKAGDLMKSAAPIVGGRGGGRPDMAQGGGPETDKIDEAVQHAADWLRAAVAP